MTSTLAQDAPAQGSEVGDDELDALLNLTPREPQAAAEPARKERPQARARRTKPPTRRARRARPELPPGYEALRTSWHDPWPESSVSDVAEQPQALVLHPVGKVSTPFVLLPSRVDGGFDDEQLAVASQAFGAWSGGPSVSERLLDLIYNAAKQFGVFHVHLISGLRRDRGASRHSHGLAADIVLPGVDDEQLAAFFRAQGFVGVGVYTRAGFVHIDVRDRSYFWIDRSPPGRRYRIQAVRADEAKAADEAAVARGQTGFVNPTRLQKALSARQKRKRAKGR